MLWVPEGFAHGFMALEDNTAILYRTTKEYSKEWSRGVLGNDPALGITVLLFWPNRYCLIRTKAGRSFRTQRLKHRCDILDYSCKVCGSNNLVKVLDLGSMPNANGFLTKQQLKRG